MRRVGSSRNLKVLGAEEVRNVRLTFFIAFSIIFFHMFGFHGTACSRLGKNREHLTTLWQNVDQLICQVLPPKGRSVVDDVDFGQDPDGSGAAPAAGRHTRSILDPTRRGAARGSMQRRAVRLGAGNLTPVRLRFVGLSI